MAPRPFALAAFALLMVALLAVGARAADDPVVTHKVGRARTTFGGEGGPHRHLAPLGSRLRPAPRSRRRDARDRGGGRRGPGRAAGTGDAEGIGPFW